MDITLQWNKWILLLEEKQISKFQLQRLLNQDTADTYVKIETERTIFIRANQTKLGTESYIHLQDALTNDEGTENLGRFVTLPSSSGRPRYTRTNSGSFWLCLQIFSPSYIYKFTTNRKWKEILRELHQCHSSEDRQDLVAWVRCV